MNIKVQAMLEFLDVDYDDYACGRIDGTLYGPEEHLDEKKKPFRFMNYPEYLTYVKKVDESEGFDVDGCTGSMPGGIVPLRQFCKEWEVAEKVAMGATVKLGEMMAKHIEFVLLVKANVQAVGGILYYLTFIGTTNGMKTTYKAKVWNYPTRVGTEFQIVFFADEREEKDIEAQNIKFCLGGDVSNAREKVPFRSTTIRPKSGQLHRDGFCILVEELKRQNPRLTHAKAKRVASRKWKLFKYSERRPFIDQAWERFKKKNAKYYPEYSCA